MGSDICSSCPSGTYSDAGQEQCLDCEPGHYQNEEGKGYCKACPLGTYQSDSGATECIDCPEDTFANVTGLAECIECERGTFADDVGSVECIAEEVPVVEGPLPVPVPVGLPIPPPAAPVGPGIGAPGLAPSSPQGGSVGTVASPAKENPVKNGDEKPSKPRVQKISEAPKNVDNKEEVEGASLEDMPQESFGCSQHNALDSSVLVISFLLVVRLMRRRAFHH